MPDHLLSISNLSIERGERLILNDFELHASGGEILQIAGENGAGKTSLMRCLSGLMPPLTADFFWRNEPVDNADMYSDELLYIGHKPAVRYQLTPLENLRWFAEVHQGQVKSVTDSLLLESLRSLGLEGYEDELCANLSAGQKRRVGLARMAISTAPLWILDEPFTAVDVKGVETLIDWIESYAASGGVVLFTTHQQAPFKKRFPRTIDLSDLRMHASENS